MDLRLVSELDVISIYSFYETTLIIKDLQIFTHDLKLMCFALAVECKSHREILFHDEALVSISLDSRLRVEENHVVG